MKHKTDKVVIKIGTFHHFIYVFFACITAMIGYTIHGSLFWAFVDFFFAPLAWIKWLIYNEVNMSIIKKTFEFFLN